MKGVYLTPQGELEIWERIPYSWWTCELSVFAVQLTYSQTDTFTNGDGPEFWGREFLSEL